MLYSTIRRSAIIHGKQNYDPDSANTVYSISEDLVEKCYSAVANASSYKG